MRIPGCARATLLGTAAALLFVSGASGQRSTTRGFMLGAHLQGASLTVQDGEPDSGGGLGIRVGYGFNRLFTGYLEVDGITFDVENPTLNGTWSMGHVDLGVRFSFANSLRSWVPFLEAAIGGRAVTVDDAMVDDERVGDVSFNGGAFSVGGGLDFYVAQTVALEALVKWTGGEFSRVDIGNISVGGLDLDATSFRFKLGVAWWP